jgi:hypothetical protein
MENFNVKLCAIFTDLSNKNINIFTGSVSKKFLKIDMPFGRLSIPDPDPKTSCKMGTNGSTTGVNDSGPETEKLLTLITNEKSARFSLLPQNALWCSVKFTVVTTLPHYK